MEADSSSLSATMRYVVECLTKGIEGTLMDPVDYILFCTLDVTHELNPNECSDARYVSKAELQAMFADDSKSTHRHYSTLLGPSSNSLIIHMERPAPSYPSAVFDHVMLLLVLINPANSFTPWFRLIARELLFPWWDEMLAKSEQEGWNAETGEGVVRAGVLEGLGRGGEVIKMV
jgi:isopentenyl-diphosphate delta-isomerase